MDFAAGIADYIAVIEAALPAAGGETLTPAARRAHYSALCRQFDVPRPAGLRVRAFGCEGPGGRIALRLYRPEGEGAQAGLLYLHGGGFVLGGLDSHDGIVAELAAAAGVSVLAVDYRLAPEHPYPAAVEDSLAAWRHLHDNAEALGVDPRRLGVGGDSAGGALAAALCLATRDGAGPRPAAQILIYPYLGREVAQPESAGGPDAPGLTHAEMADYRRAYLGGRERVDDPLALPLLAGDLGGLPPAYIMAAALDPLSEDARVYAERLAEAGVAQRHRCWPGLIHGCLRARHLSPTAGQAFAETAAAARDLLKTPHKLEAT